MKIALVYDWVDKIGGAERVLKELHTIWPEAPLYTSVYNPQKASWAQDFEIRTSFLQKFPFAKRKHELYPWAMPFVFESFDFEDFDVVVSITSSAAKGVVTKPGTLHLCYCLTPTRYLWSAKDVYLQNSGFGFFDPLAKLVYKLIEKPLKKWDFVAAQRPDQYLAISQAVKNRIKQYYQRNSKIIHPPVDVDKFSTKDKPGGDYFLLVSRLVPYKKVELAVKSFNQLKLPLKVIGKGSLKAKLQRMAESNIEFLGQVTDKQLVNYYHNCRALVMPQEEDFGIVSLEAQAAGRPVIAYAEGGAADTVVVNKTGILFKTQTVSALVSAVESFKKKTFSRQACFANALKFDKNSFRTLFKKFVEEQWKAIVNS
jgi:glycosyltransferase involved in cell wall biosynthesis